MIDLRTRYLGMELKNPLVPSSSPVTRHFDNLRKLEDAGAAAVILPSLFEEEIDRHSYLLDRYLTQGSESYAEAISYFPEALTYRGVGVEPYANYIRRAKEALSIPVIASLNGKSLGGWIDHAHTLAEAGADALELNIYFIAANFEQSGQNVEQIYLDILRAVKKQVDIPVVMKLNPFFSSTAFMARQFCEAGADGLALFNRFYQPDLDIENLEITPHLVLSNSDEMRLPLRWIAILYGRVSADLALTTGIHTAQDVLKAVAAGANITMLASVLLHHGADHIGRLLTDIERWLVEHEYESLEQLQGSLSQINCPSPVAFERANYVNIVSSF